MDEDLIARADHLQRTAFSLLDHLHLMSLWSALGTPLLVGSAYTGLMIEANIDLYILVDKPDIDACFELLHTIARDTASFQDVYLNLRSHLPEPDPTLYVGIGYQFGGEDFGFDHLILSRNHPHAYAARQMSEAILAGLDIGKRTRILRIKRERLEMHGIHMKGGGGLDSLDIYRAVFNGSAQTYKECETWAAGHPRREYEPWLPGQVGAQRVRG